MVIIKQLDQSNDYETIDDLPQAKNQPVKDIESSYSKINQSMKNHSSSKSSNPTKSALNTPLSNGRNDSNSSNGFENAVLRFYSKISPLKCFLFILLICILIIVAIVITVLVIIHKHPQESIMSTIRPTTTTTTS
uniref:Uncharacterized protein n=1 Tax=Acrobeloides nanus TaxID=290746 RepID=A0A914BUU6_9BILA